MLSLEPWTLFWAVVNVVVLFLALRKFLVKPVMSVIEQRETMVKEQLKKGQKTMEEVDSLKKEYEKNLADAKTQAEEIITSARVRAEEEHAAALVQTKAESERMIKQAKDEIRHEQEKAEQEVKEQIAVLAMSAARKIIKTGDIHDAGSNE